MHIIVVIQLYERKQHGSRLINMLDHIFARQGSLSADDDGWHVDLLNKVNDLTFF